MSFFNSRSNARKCELLTRVFPKNVKNYCSSSPLTSRHFFNSAAFASLFDAETASFRDIEFSSSILNIDIDVSIEIGKTIPSLPARFFAMKSLPTPEKGPSCRCFRSVLPTGGQRLRAWARTRPGAPKVEKSSKKHQRNFKVP